MKVFSKEEFEKRTKKALKTTLKRLQDFEEKYPDQFQAFLKESM